MKTMIRVLLFLLSIISISSCDGTKSYSERLRDQKKAINQLINEEKIEILTKYPADGVFGEKQFVLLDNEVYLNVVDSGNGKRAVTGKTVVLVRCSGRSLFWDSLRFSTFPNSYEPMEFIYGMAEVVMSQYASNYYSDYYYCLSVGMESVLEYVGENAVVKLIVPFDIGSLYQASDELSAPFYYDKVKFSFYSHPETATY